MSYNSNAILERAAIPFLQRKDAPNCIQKKGSVKTPWHRSSMRVAHSRSWAPATILLEFLFYFIYFIQSHRYKLQKVHNYIRNIKKRGKRQVKKVVSDSLWLVDFAIRLVNSVVNLPNGQVMFFWAIGHLHDGVIILLWPESFRVLLSCAN